MIDESSFDDDDLLLPPDEDSILGEWMQDILRPGPPRTGSPDQPPLTAAERPTTEPRQEAGGGGRLEEPIAYLLLASQVLTWLAGQMKTGSDDEEGWMVEYTVVSANAAFIDIVGDLLKEVNSDVINKVNANSWSEFSASLFVFTQNLVGVIGAKPALSTQLLSSLGLDPTLDKSQPWILDAPPRSLAVLAQIILVRQKGETDGYGGKVTAHFILMWERALSSMSAAALDANTNVDVNVENLQLLLMFFHSLQLMQKKQVVLKACNDLLRVASHRPDPLTPQYCIMVSRLCLIVDYIIRHLYEPPTSLLPQVKSNLFHKTSFTSKPAYFPVSGMEDNAEKPRFYLLSPHSYSNSMDVPKLDGLAVNFLLTAPESLDYPALYEALITRIDIIKLGSAAVPGKCVNYCFSILWRLLQSLPPPAPFLIELDTTAEMKQVNPDLQYGFILHALMVGPRAANKNFASWMKDCLVKQGLKQMDAEALIRSVAGQVNCIAFQGWKFMSWSHSQRVVSTSKLAPDWLHNCKQPIRSQDSQLTQLVTWLQLINFHPR